MHDAAVREAREEAGITVELGGVRAVVGGPRLRIRYPNGDETSYVTTVYDARIVGGVPQPDGKETTEVAWFAIAELPQADLSDCTRALLTALGLPAER